MHLFDTFFINYFNFSLKMLNHYTLKKGWLLLSGVEDSGNKLRKVWLFDGYQKDRSANLNDLANFFYDALKWNNSTWSVRNCCWNVASENVFMKYSYKTLCNHCHPTSYLNTSCSIWYSQERLKSYKVLRVQAEWNDFSHAYHFCR